MWRLEMTLAEFRALRNRTGDAIGDHEVRILGGRDEKVVEKAVEVVRIHATVNWC